METRKLKLSTLQSTLRPCKKSIGISRTRGPRLQTDSSRPDNPPSSDSKRLSTSNCRTSRNLSAPSAARIASSLRRDRARAKTRLAILAQAISNTRATAARRRSKGVRAPPTMASRRGKRRTPDRLLVSGYSRASLSAIVVISAWAWLSQTTGFSRPMVLSQC
jgi:hypothetical protein